MPVINIQKEIEKYFNTSSLPQDGQPTFVVFTGIIGSGKTTIRRESCSKGYVTLDACEIFCSLTNGGHGVFGKDFFDEMNAIGAGVLDRAVQEKRNIVVEQIGSEPGVLETFVAFTKDLGYKLDIRLVECEPAEAFKRHVEACQNDPSYISAYNAEPALLKWLLDLWNKIKEERGDAEPIALKIAIGKDAGKDLQAIEKINEYIEKLRRQTLSSFVDRALRIAIEAHQDQKRKGDGSPYIIHPVAVALKLASAGFSEKVIAAALVHDVLEDTDYPEEKLLERLAREVVDIVKAVTNDGSLSWIEKKEKYIETVRKGPPEAKAVCTADKIHNLESLLVVYEKEGDAIWVKFNRGKDDQMWFHEAVLQMLKETWSHPMLVEYEALTRKAKASFKGR